jgi:exopolysaccharide biosynthesis WecB/TagA/CpsF family protein
VAALSAANLARATRPPLQPSVTFRLDTTERVPPLFDILLMPATQQILGLRFFNGDVDGAIAFMFRHGGFLVAPSGTCFARLRRDTAYREAMTHADLAIPDSGAMVLLWRILRGQKIRRISGLKYFQHLSARFFADKTSSVLWVLPDETARDKTARWLRANQLSFADVDLYIAPRYRAKIEDRELLAKIDHRTPAHVVIGIGSGPQEKLGHFLREHLSYRPAIHCLGAALGFLTGDQIRIPGWADRFYLGWLLRLFAQPHIFIPRLTRALELPWLIVKYGEKLPPLEAD